VQYFRRFPVALAARTVVASVEGKKLWWIPREMVRANSVNEEEFFEVASPRPDCGLRDDAIVHFYNHHPAHALPTLFYTEWDDALERGAHSVATFTSPLCPETARQGSA
jgi:carbamoyltransferase